MIKQGTSCVDSGQGYYEKMLSIEGHTKSKYETKSPRTGVRVGRNTKRGNNPRMKLTIKDTWKVAQKKRVVL
ncbi:MAG: hypothetical protein NTW71_14780 [Deltaproteobacteria bacterium]|nr:hypothetical protein [Deltaproteobacteria bacterium]